MAGKWKARRKVNLGHSREASQFVWVLAELKELHLSVPGSCLQLSVAL